MADNNDNFTSMQEDAIRRVREMQRRSRAMTGTGDEGTSLPKEGPKDTDNALPFRLSDLHIDQEKAMIGLLIYILHKQGADVKLLLALGMLLL